MNKIFYYALCLATGFAVTACGGNEKTDDKAMEMNEQNMNDTYVDTMSLKATGFDKQIVCNGRLRAKAKSELCFTTQGITTEIYVKEGMRVPKGALIAEIDKDEKEREVERAERELERAEVELTDKLIGLGYEADLRNVPADVMKRAEVTSGYYTAKYQLQAARKGLNDCSLRAPFAGRIANMEGRLYQRNDKLCTLIDDSRFDVEFKILEAELENVVKGQKVKVSPYVNDSIMFEGEVTDINPTVDEKGLIKITACIGSPTDALMDGMNVRIIVEQHEDNMFVVPKDAVVERDGYHVVFRYEDGHAVWTYVDILYSNINSYAITGCKRKETSVKEGDVIITSGNQNLADGTDVKLY